jgi:hypothetical protein
MLPPAPIRRPKESLMAAAQKMSIDSALQSASSVADSGPIPSLRRAIYSKERVTRDDLLQLLQFGRGAVAEQGDAYSELLSEVATDLLVRQADPTGYLDAGDADWLIAQLADGGGLSCRAEFAMLVDVLRFAVSAPPALTAFGVREVEKAILSGRRTATGEADHAAGIVTKEDVAALLSLVFAATEGSSLHVTRESAEALFDIAHATAAAPNDPGFDDFFAKAVGNYLMGVSFHWTAPAAEVREHQRWADRPASFGDFFSTMEKALTKSFGKVSTATKTVDEIDEVVFGKENASDAAEIQSASAIDGTESDWVVAHLTRQGPLSQAEKCLLAFLAREAASMPPALRALVEKQG